MSGNTINIPGYPMSNRVPGVYSVIDASKANTGQQIKRALLIGQMTSAGAATAGMPLLSAGVGDARTQFGAGSQLAIAVERYRALDNFTELWCLPLADAASSVAATLTAAFSGTPTAAGTLPLYVDGNPIPVAVSLTDTATTIGASVASAINDFVTPGGNPLPCTAANATGTVTLTARNKGTLGNQMDVRFAYRGSAAGEVTPAQLGLTATITPASNGAVDPTIATALANLPAKPFHFIYLPYADATSTTAMTAFLSDAAGRWNWSEELFGHAFTASAGTFSTRSTFGQTLNDQHLSVCGASNSPSPAWHWAADWTAVHAVSLGANPALPVGGLGGGMAVNVLAPPLADQDSFTESNTLLYDGFSTYIADDTGRVRVWRSITTYQTTAGVPDDSYLDTTVPFCLEAWIEARKAMLTTQFNQAILVADGSRIPPGSAMITSQTVKASVIALYRRLAAQGIVQNPDQFAQQMQAQNAGNGVVALLEPIQLANQLYVVAADVQFTRP